MSNNDELVMHDDEANEKPQKPLYSDKQLMTSNDAE
jgi:hypothetical protein